MSTSTRLTREQLTEYIFVRVFLGRCKTAETLLRLREKRKNPYTDDAEAMLDAAIVLKSDAERCVNEALKRGQLLFCVAGTTVLQGGAA